MRRLWNSLIDDPSDFLVGLFLVLLFMLVFPIACRLGKGSVEARVEPGAVKVETQVDPTVAALAARIDHLELAVGVRVGPVDSSTTMTTAGRDVVESEVAKTLADKLGDQLFWSEWRSSIRAGLWILVYILMKRFGWLRAILNLIAGKEVAMVDAWDAETGQRMIVEAPLAKKNGR